jgi:aspartyl-tRNA(Asn)/glutamyl-tRNA(Gln) amidotransferase subunit B
MSSLINAGALDLVLESINGGLDPAAARKWWLGELSRIANERGVSLEDLPVDGKQLSEVESLISAGELNDKLARQVIEGLTLAEGSPREIMAKRGLALVSDDALLITAIDEALAANPGIADKIREGKIQAAGAIVGAVMKSTRGQADAARVQELILERIK